MCTFSPHVFDSTQAQACALPNKTKIKVAIGKSDAFFWGDWNCIV